MSLRPGTSIQPDSEVSSGTSSAAPQRGQLLCDPSETAPHHGHFTAAEWTAGGGRFGGWAWSAGAAYEDAGSAAGAAVLDGITGACAPQFTQKLADSGIPAPQKVQNIRDPYSV
ncbi:MAG TPA: hypothetical protein VGR73_11605 [Bryobacteraceae bacterium]|nr:hypothetical protein [Bryobacteraceae bacterium]